MTNHPKIRILFLCTGNSCRSQMAEGWARHLKGGEIEAHSAGTIPQPVNPNAVKVMSEVGVDLSRHQSKHISDLQHIDFDYVITVCADADKNCPTLSPLVTKIHVGFDDPPRLAAAANSEAETLAHYRRVRDKIKAFVSSLPEYLAERDLT